MVIVKFHEKLELVYSKILRKMKTLILCLKAASKNKFTATGVVTVMGIAIFFVASPTCHAQGPGGKSFGFGLILGEPLGATVKLWTNPENAFVGDIGASYFGALRIQG